MAKKLTAKAFAAVKKALKPVAVRRNTASCTIYSTAPMKCPLCETLVPKNTLHECERRY